MVRHWRSGPDTICNVRRSSRVLSCVGEGNDIIQRIDDTVLAGRGPLWNTAGAVYGSRRMSVSLINAMLMIKMPGLCSGRVCNVHLSSAWKGLRTLLSQRDQ